MCGISGFCSAAPRDRAVLEAMNATLRHRGPDDTGVWLSGGRSSNGWTAGSGTVGLAQRRLAILDLSPAGRNPMANDDGTLWISYNGEVFNFREVRNELEGAGFQFRTQTDSEVILKAYERWGRECVHRFLGMFAFAIWDSRRSSLFVARDRLGIKPLYYLERAGEIAFASELKALRAHPACPTGTIDREALGSVPAISSTCPVRARSIGRPAEASAGHIGSSGEPARRAHQRYWDPRRARAEAGWRAPSEDRALRALRVAAARDAVRYRMIADVPLGAFLSGGVDSSAVASLMQESAAAGQDVHHRLRGAAARRVFTTRRPSPPHLRTEHTRALHDGRGRARSIPRPRPHFDEPFADSSAIPTMLVSRFAREHVTVALSRRRRRRALLGLQPLLRLPEAQAPDGRAAWIRRLWPGPCPSRPTAAPSTPPNGSAWSMRRTTRYLRFVTTLGPAEVARLSGARGVPSALYEDARRRLGESRP